MERALSVKETAEILGVSTDWVYAMAKAGAIPHRRLPSESRTGGGYLIKFLSADIEQIFADAAQPVVTAQHLGRARTGPVVPLRSRRRSA